MYAWWWSGVVSFYVCMVVFMLHEQNYYNKVNYTDIGLPTKTT